MKQLLKIETYVRRLLGLGHEGENVLRNTEMIKPCLIGRVKTLQDRVSHPLFIQEANKVEDDSQPLLINDYARYCLDKVGPSLIVRGVSTEEAGPSSPFACIVNVVN